MQYKITEDESDKIANLFYSYQAIVDLLKSFDNPGSQIYLDLLDRLQTLKRELETEKLITANKYIKDSNKNYTFNFIDNSIIITDP